MHLFITQPLIGAHVPATPSKRDTMRRAAMLYYLQQETMETIARDLGVSRSTVSRLLRDARDTGMVRITMADEATASSRATDALAKRFRIAVHVAPIAGHATTVVRLEAASRLAAHLLEDLVVDGCTLGVAWGTTMSAVAQHLRPRPRRGVTVLQLNGAANPTSTGVTHAGSLIGAFAQAFDADVLHFPVPAFFDFPETRAAMWRERSVRRILEAQQTVDVAIFGVGSPSGELPSEVYAGDYLDAADMRLLADEGVVGDVCTVMLRADGTYADIAMNRRATGPTPRMLTRIPRRICVAAGDAKVLPLLAALRAHVVTDLVVDQATAEGLLTVAQETPVGRPGAASRHRR